MGEDPILPEPAPRVTCPRCGEPFAPCTHGLSRVRTPAAPDDYLSYCDGCAEEGSALGSVLHICADEDALGLGGHTAFMGSISEEEVRAALRGAFSPKKRGGTRPPEDPRRVGRRSRSRSSGRPDGPGKRVPPRTVR